MITCRQNRGGRVYLRADLSSPGISGRLRGGRCMTKQRVPILPTPTPLTQAVPAAGAAGPGITPSESNSWVGGEARPLQLLRHGQGVVQREGGDSSRTSSQVHQAADAGLSGRGGSLPFLSQIQASFGKHDVSTVSAHTDDRAAAASHTIGARAFARGDQVAFGATPDLHTAAHEAAHVVQQREGVHLKGGVGEAGDAYEQHADQVADRVVQGESAQHLLDIGPTRGGQGDALQMDGGLTDEQYAAAVARTKTLVGKWCEVDKNGAMGIDPHNIDKRTGAWGRTGSFFKPGTKVFAVGMVASDGAIQGNVAQLKGGQLQGFQSSWFNHYELVPSTAPAEVSTQVKNTLAKDKTSLSSPEEVKNTQKRDAGMKQISGAKSFGVDFTKAAGALLDAVVPQPGDKSKVQLNFNIPAGNLPGTFISGQFTLEAERTQAEPGKPATAQTKVRTEVGIGVMTKADLWLVEVFAKAMLFGYMEAQGDNGFEVFRLYDLIMYKAVAAVSQAAADCVWGKGLPEAVRKDVVKGSDDKDDYVEGGFAGEFSVGASAKVGSQDRSVTGSRRASAGSKYYAADPNKAKKTSSVKTTLGLSIGDWGGEAYIDEKSEQGQGSGGEVAISASRMIELGSFAEMVGDSRKFAELAGQQLSMIAGQTVKLINGVSALQNKQATKGQTVGALVGMVGSFSMSSGLAKTAAIEKLKGARGIVGKVGQKFTIKISWGMGSPTRVEISLDRASLMERGKNANDPIYVAIENISNIFYKSWSF